MIVNCTRLLPNKVHFIMRQNVHLNKRVLACFGQVHFVYTLIKVLTRRAGESNLVSFFTYNYVSFKLFLQQPSLDVQSKASEQIFAMGSTLFYSSDNLKVITLAKLKARHLDQTSFV